MLNDMAGYMSIVINLFFVFMLLEIVRAAAQPIPHIHPVFPLILMVGGTIAILFYYFGQFRRIAKDESDKEDPNDITT